MNQIESLFTFREYLGKQLEKESEGSNNSGVGSGPATIQGKA